MKRKKKKKKIGRPAARTFPALVEAGKQRWMQVRAAAKELGVHRTRVYQLIKAEKWETLNQHGLRWVLESQVKLEKIHRREHARSRS